MNCFWESGCSDRKRCKKFGSCVAAHQNANKDEILGRNPLGPSPLEEVEQADLNSEVICPFCSEGGFDLIGLKNHYTSGFCDVFNETIDI